MSRQNKRNKRNVRPIAKQEVKRENVSYIPKEESPKGETFFKIVLTLMIVGILGVVTYFIVDGIIGNKSDDDRLFDSSMYLSVVDVQALINENYGAITNSYLQLALEQHDGIDNVIIVFYHGDYEDRFEGTIKNRHESVVSKVNGIRDLTEESEDHEGFMYGRGYAVFYMDVSDSAILELWNQGKVFEGASTEDLENPKQSTPLLMHVAISHPEYNGLRYVVSSSIVGELQTIYETMEAED